MRKDVTLGMSIGGVLLAVVIVIISLSGHNKANRHPVETGPIADSGQTTDPATPTPPETPTAAPTDTTTKPDVASTEPAAPPPPVATTDGVTLTPPVDTSPATKPTEPTVAANTESNDKHDPTWGDKLWGNNQTPLIGVSTTPDPNAEAARKLELMLGGTSAGQAPKTSDTVTKVPTIAANDRPATTGPSNSSRTHIVQKGETFSTIAATVYGSANFYPYLLRANPQLNPKALRPGMVINIPDAAAVKPPEKAAISPALEPKTKTAQTTAIDSGTQYRVQPGDNLNKIALSKFGKIDMVSRIYELNKQIIGDDPAKLKVGMVLAMPPAPTAVASH